MVSIVITYHNEGQPFIEECVAQVHKTCRLSAYEVIVVDDCSDVPLSPLPATIVRNPVNIGVGGSFDRGIEEARGDIIIMMGDDMRFLDNGWALKLVRDVEEHPNGIICTRCVGLRREDMDIEKRKRTRPNGHGCNLLLHYKNDILCAQWAPKRKETIYKVPVVMGACYGFRKEWFKHIDGWNMYRGKGALEAFLSMKSWIFGGECLVDRTIATGHIYRDKDEHKRKLSDEYYNKLLMDYWWLDGELSSSWAETPALREARRLFSSNIREIDRKKREYASKAVMGKDEYLSKYIDIRKLNGK